MLAPIMTLDVDVSKIALQLPIWSMIKQDGRRVDVAELT